jgi:DNA-binding CsgD family transcriptional regulator
MDVTLSEIPAAVRMRGTAAVRFLGDLLSHAASATDWDAAVFSAGDQLILSEASRGEANIDAVRAELRLQRFASMMLPHVGTALSVEDRHVVFAIIGRAPDRLIVFRLLRASAVKGFGSRDGAPLERFLRSYGGGIIAAVFGDEGEIEPLANTQPTPAFLVDGDGRVLSAPSDADPDEVNAHLIPRDGEVPAMLRPIVLRLLAAWREGVRGAGLSAQLPFAVVRLTAMRGRAGDEFLVSFEWLRTRASLEVAAARYAISKRELQVLGALLRGAPVAEIAGELSISESTVIFHLKRMLKKTQAKNRTELAARMLGWEISA